VESKYIAAHARKRAKKLDAAGSPSADDGSSRTSIVDLHAAI